MRRFLMFAALTSLFASSLIAQAEPRRFGIGMAFTAFGVGGSGIHLPIALSPERRLEPAISVSRFSTTFDLGGPGTQEQKSTSIELSVAMLFMTDAGANTKLYTGPRVGLAWSRTQISDPSFGSTDSEHTDWLLSVAAGGEHFLSERFSLGGEARFGYYHAGEPKGTGGFTTSRLSTGAAAFLRWYP